MVLHELDDRVDRLPPEVLLAATRQRVRLVDEQGPAERRLHDGARARRRLADVPGDEVRAVGLDEMTLGHDPEGTQDLAQQAGDGGLARAGIAGEHEVVARLDRRQATLGTQALDPQQAGQATHVGLDVGESDQCRRARPAAPPTVGQAAARASRSPPPGLRCPSPADARRCRRASPAGRRRPRRTRRGGRCGNGRWPRSRRARGRGRRPRRREPGGSRSRSSAPLADRPCSRRRAAAGRTACSGVRASAACPRASLPRAGGSRTRAPGDRGEVRRRRATPPARRP